VRTVGPDWAVAQRPARNARRDRPELAHEAHESARIR
jgi:hypothetical protein